MSGPTGNDKQPTEQHSAKKYSQPGCSKTKKIKTHKKTKQNQDSEESEDEPEPVLLDSSDDDEDWEGYRLRELEKIAAQEDEDVHFIEKLKPIVKQIDSFVVVVYENKYYPGVIEHFEEYSAYVSAKMKSLNNWKWPVNKDVIFYKWEQILGSINPPQILSKRGIFSVKELEGEVPLK